MSARPKTKPRAVPASSKQLALLDVPEMTKADLATHDEIQERHRIKQVEAAADERRHDRWQLHNRGSFNLRDCPCRKCIKARAAALRASR